MGPLDVVIHIHGGAFMIGSPSVMAGPDYIMDRDVIYVSFNYRLGVLGTKTILLIQFTTIRMIH